ncbi:hypothetical protein GGR52DRAFT_218289 [Hypoxylon sp. FL1284]|nr:hypothetical protein GGR52DRAFT_218289 [Hypoxylon sp. FL1284]
MWWRPRVYHFCSILFLIYFIIHFIYLFFFLIFSSSSKPRVKYTSKQGRARLSTNTDPSRFQVSYQFVLATSLDMESKAASPIFGVCEYGPPVATLAVRKRRSRLVQTRRPADDVDLQKEVLYSTIYQEQRLPFSPSSPSTPPVCPAVPVPVPYSSRRGAKYRIRAP